MKLLHKLLILVLSLSVIPLGVVGWQALDGLQKEIDVDLQALFKEKVSSNGRLIELQMENLVKKVVEAVHFRRLGSMTEEEMGVFSTDLIRQFGELRIVTVLDEMGEEVVSALSKGKVSPFDLRAHLDTLTPAMLEAVAKEDRRFSEIYFRDSKPRVTLYSRFKFPDRAVEGTVAIGVSLSSVKYLIDEIEFSKSQDGRILLFDNRGKLLAGKGGNRELEDLIPMEDLTYVQDAFAKREKVSAGTGVFKDLEGKESIGAHAFLSSNIDWMLLISEPKDEVFASADLLFDRTVGMILITVVLSLLGGLMMARKIVKPLKALVKGANEIGAGNLEYKIPKLSSDEIGVLCDSFSKMGSSLMTREITIGRIRGISAELNSIFEKKAVINVGSDALRELIPDIELELWLHHDGQWSKFGDSPKGILSSHGEDWTERQEIQLVQGPDQQLLVPLGKSDPKTGWNCKGMMILRRKEFSLLDQQVAQILSGSMAVSMVNIEFLHESVDNERRAHELEIAELVQKTLFPDSDPEFSQIDFGSFLVSSSETGGDWYGYIESADKKRLSVLIGDVTGHGAPAALLTAATNAFFKTVEHLSMDLIGQNLPIDLHDPIFLLKLLNQVILETARGRLVMTFFISTIDMETGEMIYANAGHNIPWILRADPDREVTFDDLPSHVETSVPKVKREGGKLKIKVGGKKTAVAEPAVEEEAAPKKKIKIRVGAKKIASEEPASGDDARSSSTEIAADTAEAAEEAPKKKLKFKIGSKSRSDNKASSWENVNGRGMRLGEVEDAKFDCRRTRLFKGDMMVWYTDGWIENTSPTLEEFGKKRCQAVMEENKHLAPMEIIEKLREASWDFYEEMPREDDVTIVIGKIKEDW